MPPDGFYTDDQGRVRPITRRKGAGVLIAIGVAVALGAGGAGAATAVSAGSTNSSAASRAQPKTQAKPRVARLNDIKKRLERAGLRAVIKNSRTDTDCAANSYGQVREFFREHACNALVRALIEVRDGRAVALVAVAIVDMPDEQGAIALKRLSTSTAPATSPSWAASGSPAGSTHHGARARPSSMHRRNRLVAPRRPSRWPSSRRGPSVSAEPRRRRRADREGMLSCPSPCRRR
jgi:hypothetical protein